MISSYARRPKTSEPITPKQLALAEDISYTTLDDESSFAAKTISGKRGKDWLTLAPIAPEEVPDTQIAGNHSSDYFSGILAKTPRGPITSDGLALAYGLSGNKLNHVLSYVAEQLGYQPNQVLGLNEAETVALNLPIFEKEIGRVNRAMQQPRFTSLRNAASKLKNAYYSAANGLDTFANAHPRTASAARFAAYASVVGIVPLAAIFGAGVAKEMAGHGLESKIIADSGNQPDEHRASGGTADLFLQDLGDDVLYEELIATEGAPSSFNEPSELNHNDNYSGAHAFDIQKLESKDLGTSLEIALELKGNFNFKDNLHAPPFPIENAVPGVYEINNTGTHTFYLISLDKQDTGYGLLLNENGVFFFHDINNLLKPDAKNLIKLSQENYEVNGNKLKVTIDKDLVINNEHQLSDFQPAALAFRTEAWNVSILSGVGWLNNTYFYNYLDKNGPVFNWSSLDDRLNNYRPHPPGAFDQDSGTHLESERIFNFFKALYQTAKSSPLTNDELLEKLAPTFIFPTGCDFPNHYADTNTRILNESEVFTHVVDYSNLKSADHPDGFKVVEYICIYKDSKWRGAFEHQGDGEIIKYWVDNKSEKVFRTASSMHTIDLIYDRHVPSFYVENGSHGMIATGDKLKMFGLIPIDFNKWGAILGSYKLEPLSNELPYPDINAPWLGERAKAPIKRQEVINPNDYYLNTLKNAVTFAKVAESPELAAKIAGSEFNINGLVDGQIKRDSRGLTAYLPDLEALISYEKASDIEFMLKGIRDENYTFWVKQITGNNASTEFNGLFLPAKQGLTTSFKIDWRAGRTLIKTQQPEGKVISFDSDLTVNGDEFAAAITKYNNNHNGAGNGDGNSGEQRRQDALTWSVALGVSSLISVEALYQLYKARKKKSEKNQEDKE